MQGISRTHSPRSSYDAPSQRRRITATVVSVVAAVALFGGPVAHPSAYANEKNGEDNTTAQCQRAHQAVDQGEPLPELELFRKGHGAVHNGKVVIFDDSDRYSDDIKAAANSWTDATNGAITFDVVHEGTAHSVRVFDVNRDDATWVGWTRHNPYRVLLNADYLDEMTQSDRQGTIAHEFGHLIGLKHGCPGDLMHAVSDH
nr:M43 family zinc metalloprotease [Corynebacterium parakroppenstedtii]